MFLTSISLSFVFLGISIISLIFLFYFKTLVIKTSPTSHSRDRIIGDMKDPIAWRERNNRMAYVSLFWTIISLAAFIYFKFFYKAGLISTLYLVLYVALIAISAAFMGFKRKASI